MFSRILVVIDGSIAQPVLGWVRRLLAPVGGDVRLLVVLPQVRAVVAGGRTVAFADQREDGARRAAEFALSGLVARLQEDGLAASVEVRFGKPATAILGAAQAWRAEAIAVHETRQRAWHRWLSSDVVDEVLKLSSVPVLIARVSEQRSA